LRLHKSVNIADSADSIIQIQKGVSTYKHALQDLSGINIRRYCWFLLIRLSFVDQKESVIESESLLLALLLHAYTAQ